ncbi:MAG: multiple sugar transport system permease protein, partial [Kribbellaceae bacterium]|nr:multiple sugar transport system permease protein [Kribbellaceae bacterium]
MIRNETLAGRIARFGGLGICLLFTVFPLYWILVTSFKDPGSIFAYPLKYWPNDFSLENYRGLFGQSNFAVFLVNSLIVSTVAAALATVISLLSAYVLARFEFVSKGAVMGAFLVTQMIPGFIALGSLYILMTKLYLVDNRFGLILVYVAVSIPLCTVMLRGFFENVPASLEEAAMVDGCSRLSALFRVLVPVMTPGLAASYIFNFVNCWNELFLSVTLMNSDSNKTIPAALNGFISSYNIDWGSMSAAAVLSIVPTMVLFAFASRYIVEGLTAG